MLWTWLRRLFGPGRVGISRACEQFRQARQTLQQQFYQRASTSGKPRGLRWKACDWDEPTAFARDRQSGQFIAFASVTISFEAIEGGDMEDLPAVANLRNATAVFFYQDQNWQTAGKTIFNLNPDEVISRYRTQYEPVTEAG